MSAYEPYPPQAPQARAFQVVDPILSRPHVLLASGVISGGESWSEEVLRRAQGWARTDSLTTLRLYDIRSASEMWSVITEPYVGSLNFDDPTQGNRLETFPLSHLRAVMFTLLTALETAHSDGVVHGALCPAALELQANGKLKLGYFSLELLDARTGAQTERVLRLGYFSSPGQIVGSKATVQDDIYGLGVFLYRMVYGRYPYQALDWPPLIHLILHGTPDFPPTPAHIPDSLVSSLRRCLARDPQERFASVSELREALDLETVDGEPTEELDWPIDPVEILPDEPEGGVLAARRPPPFRPSTSQAEPTLNPDDA